jgi:hypothetical protein
MDKGLKGVVEESTLLGKYLERRRFLQRYMHVLLTIEIILKNRDARYGV